MSTRRKSRGVRNQSDKRFWLLRGVGRASVPVKRAVPGKLCDITTMPHVGFEVSSGTTGLLWPVYPCEKMTKSYQKRLLSSEGFGL